VDIRVLAIDENTSIFLQVDRVGIYQGDDDEYDDVKSLPLGFLLRHLEAHVYFSEVAGDTEVRMESHVRPSASWLLKAGLWLIKRGDLSDSQEAMQQWASIVERYFARVQSPTNENAR